MLNGRNHFLTNSIDKNQPAPPRHLYGSLLNMKYLIQGMKKNPSDYKSNSKRHEGEMNFVLVRIIHCHSENYSPRDAGDLLRIAIAWGERKEGGYPDALLIIGAGFESKETLQAFLTPYGLKDAELATFSENYPEILAGEVENILNDWVYDKHRAAIPILQSMPKLRDSAYPTDGWWWMGIESAQEELSPIYSGMKKLLPTDFELSASTWLELLLDAKSIWLFESDRQDHETGLLALTLTRWLCGFDAITGNNSYNFSDSIALEFVPIHPVRLVYEAATKSGAMIEYEFQDEDTENSTLLEASLHACLVERTGALAATLRQIFGGDTALLWSLYASIWPNYQKPASRAASDLVSLGYLSAGELEPLWRFVTEGWVDMADE
jgi:hypothetical protein